MSRILSPGFWFSTLISVFITMCLIYLFKKFTANKNIPLVSEVSRGI